MRGRNARATGPAMPRAVLGLGSNLGARRAILAAASALLDAQPGCRVLARSAVYETPPLGPPQPDYLNGALLVEWVGQVESLLALGRHVETLLGRERRERWGPRTLDIDVLHWSEGAVRTPELEVPHPGLLTRSFALGPALDVLSSPPEGWAHALQALGGRPPCSAPGWLSSARVGDAQELTAPDWPELMSLFVGAVSVWGPRAGRPRSTLPFCVSDTAEHGLHLLLERVSACQRAGFCVWGAAVTQLAPCGWRGVFLGEQVGSCGPLPPLTIQRTTEFGLRIARCEGG